MSCKYLIRSDRFAGVFCSFQPLSRPLLWENRSSFVGIETPDEVLLEPLSIAIAVNSGSVGANGNSNVASIRRTSPRNTTDHFHVLVTNNSDYPQKIWDAGNSWGWGNLTFELTDGKGNSTLAVQSDHTGWGSNSDAWYFLKPKETHVFDVYLSDPLEWTGFPNFRGTDPILVIRATYEIKADVCSKTDGVWTGKAISPPIRIQFDDVPF